MKLLGRLMEGENLANEPFLLAFCQTWCALLHGTDFLLRFHNCSECSGSNQEAFKQVVDLGYLLNWIMFRLFSASFNALDSQRRLCTPYSTEDLLLGHWYLSIS